MFILRTVFRIVLLLWYKSGIQTSPPIIPLDRVAELSAEGQLSCNVSIFDLTLKQLETTEQTLCFLSTDDDDNSEAQSDTCYVGQRSGRAIRPLGGGEIKSHYSDCVSVLNVVLLIRFHTCKSKRGCLHSKCS